MRNNDSKRVKEAAYQAFADVTKALSNPRRLELLDLLVQRPRPVESLADLANMPMSTCSQHLQVLKRAALVETRRQGTTIEYRTAPGVPALFAHLLAVADARSPTLRAALDRGDEAIALTELADRLLEGDVLLLDVRPAGEFAHAHLPGAVSIPVDELGDRLDEIPEATLVVATCRGPFCAYAADAVRVLRASGRQAVRFEGGVAEWVASGRSLDRGAA